VREEDVRNGVRVERAVGVESEAQSRAGEQADQLKGGITKQNVWYERREERRGGGKKGKLTGESLLYM
jgi:hypothetical protein